MGSPKDAAIALRIGSGDATAEEELVERFHPGLMAIARVRAGVESAADLVQETMALALINLRRGDYRGDGPLGGYLAGILRHRIHAARRVGAAEPLSEDLAAAPESSANPELIADRNLLRARLRAALERLPRRHREVLLRHYLEGDTVDEVARAMGVPRGTILSRLHHARRKMAKIMNRSRLSPHLIRER